MITLSAFADEFGNSLQEQIDGCQQQGVMCIDVRKIDGRKIETYALSEVRQFRHQLDDHNFTVPCLGSGIGKIKISDPFEPHLDLLKHCFEIADRLGTRRVRIFSFHPGDDERPIEAHRSKVMARMEDMLKAAEQADMILMLENEKRIFSAKPEGMKDIVNTFPSPRLQTIFDPANYIEEGISPYDQGWCQGLREITDYFHIKDKTPDLPGCVPAGEGEGQIPDILADMDSQDRNYYMTLEPHIKNQGRFAQLSKAEKFAEAANGLKKLLQQANISFR